MNSVLRFHAWYLQTKSTQNLHLDFDIRAIINLVELHQSFENVNCIRIF